MTAAVALQRRRFDKRTEGFVLEVFGFTDLLPENSLGGFDRDLLSGD